MSGRELETWEPFDEDPPELYDELAAHPTGCVPHLPED